ncbi:MAG: 2-phospho-L-lactate guanylyltransferase, partial [Nocardioides sp.]|nr:2-phospho-L-lactate guanylyltransferase [Nocardioides sp.]
MSDPRLFTALVPVKSPTVGKSRLATMPDEQRIALATAFALDTFHAALEASAVGAVIVVTDDFRLADVARKGGCEVLPDGVTGDLNGSLVQAAHEAVRRQPSYGIAALCADLPALRHDELTAALEMVPEDGPAFVADVAGTGTTFYATRSIEWFTPAFGPGSCAAHTDAGALSLPGELASLRQDVDEAGDLGRAMVLGLGSHTRD